MTDSDRRYFERRLEQERNLAVEATCPAAREAHLRFVDLYSIRLGLAKPGTVRRPRHDPTDTLIPPMLLRPAPAR